MCVEKKKHKMKLGCKQKNAQKKNTTEKLMRLEFGFAKGNKVEKCTRGKKLVTVKDRMNEVETERNGTSQRKVCATKECVQQQMKQEIDFMRFYSVE